MHPYRNEDAAWQRLVDMQREMENSRLWADRSSHVVELAVTLARRAWIVAGLAMRRAPRHRPFARPAGECEIA